MMKNTMILAGIASVLSCAGAFASEPLGYDEGPLCKPIVEYLTRVKDFSVEGRFPKSGKISVEVRDGKLYLKSTGISSRFVKFKKDINPDEVAVRFESMPGSATEFQSPYCQASTWGIEDMDTSYGDIKLIDERILFSLSKDGANTIAMVQSRPSCITPEETAKLEKLQDKLLDAQFDKPGCEHMRGAAACLSPMDETEMRYLARRKTGDPEACSAQ